MDYDTLFRGEKVVYYADAIQGYEAPDTFQINVNIDGFLTTPTSVDVQKQPRSLVKQAIESQNSRTQLDIKQGTWDNPNEDSIFIRPTNSKITTTSFQKLMRSLYTIHNLSPLQKIDKDHDVAENYLEAIVASIAFWRYAEFKPLLSSWLSANRSNTSNPLPDGLKLAIEKLVSIIGGAESGVLAELTNACSKVLDELISKKSQSFLLHGLVEGDFTKTIYFNIREVMYHQFFPKGFENLDDNTYSYLKRLFVSLFIHTCYPYIHFLYIKGMMNYFKKRGDFVNMRISALAKIAFVTNTLNKINSIGLSSSDGRVMFDTLSDNAQMNYNQLIKNMLISINNYFAKLSNVDFKGETSLKEIAIELHEKSKKVVSQSEEIDNLKKKINTTQLDIRSYASLHSSITQEYKKEQLMYYVFVAVIFVITIGSCLVLVFKPSFAPIISMIMAIAICALFIIWIFIPLVFYFTKKDKMKV
jgi:hypothetical protein